MGLNPGLGDRGKVVESELQTPCRADSRRILGQVAGKIMSEVKMFPRDFTVENGLGADESNATFATEASHFAPLPLAAAPDQAALPIASIQDDAASYFERIRACADLTHGCNWSWQPVGCYLLRRVVYADDSLPPAIAWRQNAFSIPFKVASASGAEQQPAEIRLYVSTNGGAKWDLAQTVAPSATSFTYRAAADGEYWFLIRSVDHKGQLQPELSDKPELRVIVDTVAPRLDLTTTRGEAGEIRANWQAVDPQLNADSLKIEYQGTDGKWHPVAIDRPPGNSQRSTTTGTMTWWPTDAPATVKVRAEISDRAGNVTVSNAKADPAAKVAHNDNNGGSNSTPPLVAGSTQDSGLSSTWMPAPPPRKSHSSDTASTAAPNNQWPADRVSNDPFGRAPINAASLPDGPVESTVNPPIRNQAPAVSDDEAAAAPKNQPSREANSNSKLPLGERPRMVNARSFDLEYEVDGVGPYGIARVELWGTRDGGRTWTSYGADNDNRSPIRASVDGEGLYGFSITVQSGNGLGGQPPRAGDAPQMWVMVDLTKPVVRLTGVEPGTGEHTGELLIHWEASDEALAVRPITLQFSDRPGGPWSIIAAGLENTGSYAWRPDNRVPERIYLRIEARDEAGNISIFDTTEADGAGSHSPRSTHSRSAPCRRCCVPRVDRFRGKRPVVDGSFSARHALLHARRRFCLRFSRPRKIACDSTGVRAVWRRAAVEKRIAPAPAQRGA